MTGAELRQLRVKLGLTQAEAAEFFNVRRATYVTWEGLGELTRVLELACWNFREGSKEYGKWRGGLELEAIAKIEARKGKERHRGTRLKRVSKRVDRDKPARGGRRDGRGKRTEAGGDADGDVQAASGGEGAAADKGGGVSKVPSRRRGDGGDLRAGVGRANKRDGGGEDLRGESELGVAEVSGDGPSPRARLRQRAVLEVDGGADLTGVDAEASGVSGGSDSAIGGNDGAPEVGIVPAGHGDIRAEDKGGVSDGRSDDEGSGVGVGLAEERSGFGGRVGAGATKIGDGGSGRLSEAGIGRGVSDVAAGGGDSAAGGDLSGETGPGIQQGFTSEVSPGVNSIPSRSDTEDLRRSLKRAFSLGGRVAVSRMEQRSGVQSKVLREFAFHKGSLTPGEHMSVKEVIEEEKFG